MTMPAPAAQVHIVVLGGGFAGLAFCRRLRAPGIRITLVDRQNHHLFQPLLYQVAGSALAAPDIAQPIRSILRRRADITVRLARVEGVDFLTRSVRFAEGRQLDYDYLVIALGGVTGYFNHPEWARFAPGLKTLDDAFRIRRRLLLAFEHAEHEPDPRRVDELLTIVVIGGGPTGVELAGVVADLARRVLRCDFRRIDPARARVILIEAGDRVLDAFPPELSEKARLQLQRIGVEVRFNSRVSAMREGEVDLPGGSLRAATIIWAAGVAAAPLALTPPPPRDRAGRIRVAADLGVPGHPEVFVIGDLASLLRANGAPVPGVAPAALQMGRHAADIVAAELRSGRRPGENARPVFVYRDKGSLATIGRSAGVAWIGRLRFSGWPAWIAWLALHLVFLVGLRNRLSVLLSWTYSYFTYKRGARIVTGLD